MSIYSETNKSYYQKNREKLRLEASAMVEEYKSNPEMIEHCNFEEDIVEY